MRFLRSAICFCKTWIRPESRDFISSLGMGLLIGSVRPCGSPHKDRTGYTPGSHGSGLCPGRAALRDQSAQSHSTCRPWMPCNANRIGKDPGLFAGNWRDPSHLFHLTYLKVVPDNYNAKNCMGILLMQLHLPSRIDFECNFLRRSSSKGYH